MNDISMFVYTSSIIEWRVICLYPLMDLTYQFNSCVDRQALIRLLIYLFGVHPMWLRVCFEEDKKEDSNQNTYNGIIMVIR